MSIPLHDTLIAIRNRMNKPKITVVVPENHKNERNEPTAVHFQVEVTFNDGTPPYNYSTEQTQKGGNPFDINLCLSHPEALLELMYRQVRKHLQENEKISQLQRLVDSSNDAEFGGA